MSETLFEYEIKILRYLNGEAAPDLLWGAAMGAAVEFLLEGGYVTLTRTPGVVMYSITDKGRAALTQQEGETP